MENNLAIRLKAETLEPHQVLEKMVVTNLKSIRSSKDYVSLLRNFYAFFSAVEVLAEPIITESGIIDFSSRRDSGFISADIIALGGDLVNLPLVQVPEITNIAQAMGAMYVMEGSVLGGPYIVKMLAKLGVEEGVSFFSGYGDQTQVQWSKFVTVLNTITDSVQQEQAINTAKQTFSNFGKVFLA